MVVQQFSAERSQQSSAKVFLLRNLHEVTDTRRKLYTLVSSSQFDCVITLCIVLNTVVMAIQQVPEPSDGYNRMLDVFNDIFVFIFNIEAGLKLVAMRWCYFKVGFMVGFFVERDEGWWRWLIIKYQR